MVLSKINSKINYVEKKNLDPEDVGHQSTLYVIDVFDMPILIVLGKQKYTYSNKDVVYYPIYIVSDDKIKSQIGVYESKISDALKLVDEDGDIDIEKMGEPLLYSFVTKKYIQKSNTNPMKFIDESKKAESKEKEIEKEIIKELETQKDNKENITEEDDDEDDVIKLKVAKNKISQEKQKTDEILEDGIFTINTQYKQPALLKEEFEEDANKIKLEYKESSKNTWLEKFTKNNNYGIIDNEGGGDCFFAVIRDAFESIGQKTTVKKLRALLVSHVSEEVFEENRKLYMDFENEKKELQYSLKELTDANKIYAYRAKKITDKNEKEKIIEETKKIKTKYDEKMKELKNINKMQNDYIGHMKDIDTLEKYRNYMMTSSYWADTWAISTLEAILKIKLVIFSEEAYKKKAFDNVLNCGEINKLLLNSSGKYEGFEPNYYIMTSYSGDHYKLITYKDKHIFTFDEVPYDVKILIVNKCLEKNSGSFYLIRDFRNFKTKLGLDSDEGSPEEDDSDEDIHSHLYNKSAIFVFHSKSLDGPKPGKGSSESIDKDRKNEFFTLTSIEDWRKKLDDMWSESPFTLDNRRWASVEHYIQGSKFKKGFPDFYSQFSMDTPSELSSNSELAKNVGDLTKSKFKNYRPNKVKIDVDFNLGREEKEREDAVKAKFTQNEDLKQLLLATRDALLKQSIRRKPAEPDIILMKVRNDLR